MFTGMFDGMLGSLTFVPLAKKVTDLKLKK